MPTADNDFTTRYKFVIARTNKNQTNSLTSSNIYIAGAIGQDPYFPIRNLSGKTVRQPSTNPRFEEDSCACACEKPGAFTITYLSNTDSGINAFQSWSSSANATSYSFQSLAQEANIVQTGPNTATLNTIGQGSGGPNNVIQITAVNACGTQVATNSDAPAPCFLAGALITQADGSVKPIEEVKVGDRLLGAFGEINEVLALHRPLLGDSLIFKINGEHDTSDHHPHISVDKQFYACNLKTLQGKTYGTVQPVLLADGSEVSWKLHGLNKDRTSEMVTGIVLQTVNGGKKLETLESQSLPADTQMYNLAMSGSHTYCVNGYAVTGWPREDDFDYDTWTPKEIVA